MSNVITVKDLENVVRRINKITNSPTETYTKAKGKFTANVGNYHLDGSYGGWKLQRIACDKGSVSDVLHCGFVPKRDLYRLMQAYINGLMDGEA